MGLCTSFELHGNDETDKKFDKASNAQSQNSKQTILILVSFPYLGANMAPIWGYETYTNGSKS